MPITLIVGVLTDRYVALASDRIVSWPDLDRHEDTDTKAFNLCGHFLMGFTGAARPDGQRMERWVVDRLAGLQPTAYFRALAAATTDLFTREAALRSVRHAYLAVGFVPDRGSRKLVPVQVIVSNSVSPSGIWTRLGPVEPGFRIVRNPLENRRQRVWSVGYPMPRRAFERLQTAVRHRVRGKPDNPELLVEPLANAVLETAASSNGWVGETVMVSRLPRSAVPALDVSIPFGRTATPEWTTKAVSCVVRGPSASAGRSFYAPALVMPNMMAMGLEVSDRPQPPPKPGFAG